MKLVAAILFVLVSSSAWAEGWSVGPRFGHQNLKLHSKGFEYSTYSVQANSTGPIPLEIEVEKDNDASTGHLNTTVEGIRVSYAWESLTLISDFDFARYFSTRIKFDILALGLAGQYTFVQTESFRFYGALGLSLRQLRATPYETGYTFSFDGVDYSGKSESIQASVVNYDLGLGFSMPLSGSMSLVTEYKYSDTMTKGTLESSTHHTVRNATDSVAYDSNSKTKNVSLTTQELTLSLMFSL
ncbi:MAG TPA: hypothetical protein VFO10_11810 [Oligoflexus sp.]|uniref:hypothetical protein n=1 Tax=Oligoflexus sp. TaxID=1971216 RepID=UPI002D80C58B|nr:hypothetical protein [Oligoflexus sp.]HET9237933.1 hypothetical protein [Oligoflexus sp.]